MRGSLRNLWLLALAVGLIATRPARGDTEIFAISPETGPAGIEVRIRGRGLKGTKHVLFAVGGAAKTAQFRVVSDEELAVVTPEYYRPGAAATVAVLGPTELAVAMPAAAQTVRGIVSGVNGNEPGAGFYHVLRGGRVQSAESVALIEDGGLVDRSVAPAMQLVKNGGELAMFRNPNGIVFYEQGATLGPDLFNPRHMSARRFFEVGKITASPGVGPFLYQGTPRPDPAKIPARPPHIEAVTPAAARAGDIVSLKGRGFARTTEVVFLHPYGQSRSAGFRIVSDGLLKVEVPDKDAITGPQLLMVVTTEGLTVTLPRAGMLRAGQFHHNLTGRRIRPEKVVWLGEGDNLASSGDSFLVFIEAGGRLGEGRPGATFFVKRDGAMVVHRDGKPTFNRVPAGREELLRLHYQSGNGHIYYEPGALLPEELKKAPLGRETPAIVPSKFHNEFVILPGPLYRP